MPELFSLWKPIFPKCFLQVFFSPHAPGKSICAISNFLKIQNDFCNSRSTNGVKEIGGKLTTSFIESIGKYIAAAATKLEPELVNLLRSPGIDFQPGGPVRQPYMTHRPARLHRLAESIPELFKSKQIRALWSPLFRETYIDHDDTVSTGTTLSDCLHFKVNI